MTGGSYWAKTNTSELHFARYFQVHPTWPYLACPSICPNMPNVAKYAKFGVTVFVFVFDHLPSWQKVYKGAAKYQLWVVHLFHYLSITNLFLMEWYLSMAFCLSLSAVSINVTSPNGSPCSNFHLQNYQIKVVTWFVLFCSWQLIGLALRQYV